MAKNKPTLEEAKKADAAAVAASCDLGCVKCDTDRAFKPLRYRKNPKTGEWELFSWKLLGDWKGQYCPKCQEPIDKAERARQEKIQKERNAQLAALEKVGREREEKRRKEEEQQQKDLIKAIESIAKSKSSSKG